MIVQLLLYGYILVLELPPRLTRTLVQEAVKLPPSSVASLLGSTSAASALSEAVKGLLRNWRRRRPS